MTKKPWKPRASALGGYMRCTWRAVQDRKVYEGELPAPIERVSPGNSDLGTCGHFTLQDGMRCLFPKKQMVRDIDAFLMDCSDKIGTKAFDLIGRIGRRRKLLNRRATATCRCRQKAHQN